MASRPQQNQQTQLTQGSLTAATAAAIGAFIVSGGNPAAAGMAFVTTFATSYTLGQYGLSRAAKDYKQEVLERRIMTRSAIEPHRIVYGQAMVAGNLVYCEVTGAEKEYLHMVVALAGHEIHSVDQVWFDDRLVGPRDGNGDVTSGNFAGLARIVAYTGTTTQAADPTLVASSAGARWTSNHRGQGIAYLYLRLRFDQDVFANGQPNVRALVRGRRVYDPRTMSTVYSDNPALILRDYLTSDFGLGCAASEIDDAACALAADVCDQWVATDITAYLVTASSADSTLTTTNIDPRLSTGDQVVLGGTTAPGGLTLGATYYLVRATAQTLRVASTYQNSIEGNTITLTSAGAGVVLNAVAQKRYVARGSFQLSDTPSQIEEQIRTAMAGSTIYTGGLWTIQAGAFSAPVMSLTASDLRGPVSVRPRQPRAALQNGVRGTFVDATRNHVVTDYPPIADAAMIAQDNAEPITRELDQTWCDNQIRAQRIARIFLRRGRGAQLTLQCNLKALALRAGDTVSVTLDQLGYAAKPFRVVGWKLTGDESVLGVNLALAEDLSSYYDWSATDAIAPRLNPGLNVPSVYEIGAPTGLTCASGTAHLLKGGDGTILSRIFVSWTKAAEISPRSYELQWRKSADTAYQSMIVPAESASSYIMPVEDTATYDVRVRTVSTSGARSAWLAASHTVVGKTQPPGVPSGFGASPTVQGVFLAWTNPVDTDFLHTEVWEASSNDRATATKLADVSGNTLARSGLAGNVTRWYWIRAVDTTGNVSAWLPASATAGVSVTTGNINPNQITHDSTAFLAGGATGYLTGTGYWLGFNSGSYRWHIGNPAGSYMAWNGTALTIRGSLLTGDVQVDSSGNIRGGATGYMTGTGFWMGFSGGTYKFHIGNPSGYHMRWDGTNLTVVSALFEYSAGALIIARADTVRNITLESTTAWELNKEIAINKAGSIRALWRAQIIVSSSADYMTIQTAVAKNGTIIAQYDLSKAAGSTAPVIADYSQDISVAAGDAIQIYARKYFFGPFGSSGARIVYMRLGATQSDVPTINQD